MITMQKISLSALFRLFIISISASLIACAGKPINYSMLDKPAAPNKTNIDIYRTNDKLYFGATARIDINGKRAAELDRGDSFSADYEPGRFVISSTSFSTPGRFTLVFTAEPDTQYLLEVSPRSKLMSYGGFGYAGLVVDANVNENSGAFAIKIKKVTRNKQDNPTALPVETQTPSNINPTDRTNNVESTASPQTPKSLQDKLQQIKDLYESGLISEDVYDEQQRKLLDVNQLQ